MSIKNEKGQKQKTTIIEKVKSYKGLENLSDERAIHLWQTLKEFCLLTYGFYRQKQQMA